MMRQWMKGVFAGSIEVSGDKIAGVKVSAIYQEREVPQVSL